MKIKNPSLAVPYVAGLLDGEGSIIIIVRSKPASYNELKTPSHWLQVQITNTNKMLKEVSGGHISNSLSKSGKNRSCRAWRIIGNQTRNFLEKVIPYLIVKKEQAKLAIEFQNTRCGLKGNRSPTNEELSKRERFKRKIAKLNVKS